MIENGLYQLLTTNEEVSALISQGGVYFSLADKDASVPYVVIHTVTGHPVTTLEKTLDDTVSRFQFDCYAADQPTSKRVSKAIQSVLEDLMGTSLADGTQLQSCIVNLDFDSPYEVGGTGFVCRRILDISIWYVEP